MVIPVINSKHNNVCHGKLYPLGCNQSYCGYTLEFSYFMPKLGVRCMYICDTYVVQFTTVTITAITTTTAITYCGSDYSKYLLIIMANMQYFMDSTIFYGHLFLLLLLFLFYFTFNYLNIETIFSF